MSEEIKVGDTVYLKGVKENAHFLCGYRQPLTVAHVGVGAITCHNWTDDWPKHLFTKTPPECEHEATETYRKIGGAMHTLCEHDWAHYHLSANKVRIVCKLCGDFPTMETVFPHRKSDPPHQEPEKMEAREVQFYVEMFEKEPQQLKSAKQAIREIEGGQFSEDQEGFYRERFDSFACEMDAAKRVIREIEAEQSQPEPEPPLLGKWVDPVTLRAKSEGG